MSPPKPTAAELEILRLLFALGPSTARQVHQAALDSKPDTTYANVLRQLQLMHTKGLLNRDESQRAHVYAPAQEQESVQTNLLKELIHKAFAGSGKALVLAALKGGHVNAKERAEIQALLDEGPEK
ncbi:BlaI/MecI/CopY family transcriptional regulator [Massilia sp. SM-13]|uniref:BlaI/MecI/CopY family transcriptional regulator n=1 Tax=Pseudoduganella rhizocola TaxID=3382643 RepID=UPI0038B4777B